MVTISTLANTSLEEITETFNASFANYFFPVQFTTAMFEDKFASEGGRLDLSVGVFENNKLVAFILSFIAEVDGVKTHYNGGTGVIPAYRGKRFTTKMYAFLFDHLKKSDVAHLVLEVLTQNASAAKIYQDQGYEILREVGFYKGKLASKQPPILDIGYSIQKIEHLDWAHMQTFWDYPPTWQSSIATMKNLMMENIHLGILKENRLVGYAIYNPKIKRVHQLAIDKNHRNRGLGSALLSRISELEKAEISFLNVDVRIQNVTPFLEKRGVQHLLNQYEMTMQLD